MKKKKQQEPSKEKVLEVYKELFYNAMVNSSDIPESLDKVVIGLRNLGYHMAANAVVRYSKIRYNLEFLEDCRHLTSELYSEINHKYTNATYTILSRQKSVISLYNKILSIIAAGNEESLDSIRDHLAFRFVIHEKNPKKATALCYKFANLICKFFTSKGFTICEPSKKHGTRKGKESTVIPGIYIPEFSGLELPYINLGKDYIQDPKENGYQSLHFVYRNADGNCIEIQIRSHMMDIHSEKIATHDKHKESKSATSPLDLFFLKEVDMNGFYYDPETDIVEAYEDLIGLIIPVVLVKRSKTFVEPNRNKKRRTN